MNLKTVKLASCRYLDTLPTAGNESGQAFRDRDFEQEVLALTRKIGIGAQFGGKYFCHDVRVIRLPRHGASVPIGIGVSCSADRQIHGKINATASSSSSSKPIPAQYPARDRRSASSPARWCGSISTRPMTEIRASLSRLSDQDAAVAHRPADRRARHRPCEAQGACSIAAKAMPQYFKDHPIYYAGPAKTPRGFASGSFGPTTAGRMDSYVDLFMAAGGSFVMLAKGNRGAEVREACKKHGGFYLGSIGGPAAMLAQDYIKKVEVVEYPELGMEAIWRIEVVDFPAFIVVDDKGNDFFANL